jgi:hypothetical protein
MERAAYYRLGLTSHSHLCLEVRVGGSEICVYVTREEIRIDGGHVGDVVAVLLILRGVFKWRRVVNDSCRRDVVGANRAVDRITLDLDTLTNRFVGDVAGCGRPSLEMGERGRDRRPGDERRPLGNRRLGCSLSSLKRTIGTRREASRIAMRAERTK